ncbi:hypothetical protein UFOVP609_28 [uncultured Caudovirales phage]|uniref:Uncharacterized protein n=1 Tax=uncultured Caudovirales phage TaxID=2100421 RepID=A0A6J5N6F6_9CAUD|nr:hypothetical protein UFOVP609_28 [uncultured Caudovirales phage]
MKIVAIGLGALLVFEGIWSIQDRDPMLAAVIGTTFIIASFIAYTGRKRA